MQYTQFSTQNIKYNPTWSYKNKQLFLTLKTNKHISVTNVLLFFTPNALCVYHNDSRVAVGQLVVALVRLHGQLQAALHAGETRFVPYLMIQNDTVR